VRERHSSQHRPWFDIKLDSKQNEEATMKPAVIEGQMPEREPNTRFNPRQAQASGVPHVEAELAEPERVGAALKLHRKPRPAVGFKPRLESSQYCFAEQATRELLKLVWAACHPENNRGTAPALPATQP